MKNAEIMQQFKERKYRHLAISAGLDALGMFTYVIPIIGELGDIIYAPIYGISIFMMYRLRAGSAALGGIGGFAEEILPWTDIIPSALIMWAYHYGLMRDSTFKKFAKQQAKDNRVIDDAFHSEYNRVPKRNVFKRIASVFYEFPEKQKTPFSPYEELPSADQKKLPSGPSKNDFV